MLTIKVLGSGCKNCQLLAEKAAEALQTVANEQPEEFEAAIVKVTEYPDIMKYAIQDLRSLPSRKLNEAELELSTPFISIF